MRIDTILSQTFLGATGAQIAKRLPITSRTPTRHWPEESFWLATPGRVLAANPSFTHEVDRKKSLAKLGLSIEELLSVEDPETFEKTDEASELAVGLWLVIVSMHLWQSEKGTFTTFPAGKARNFFFWLHAWWDKHHQGKWPSSPIEASHTHLCCWREIAFHALQFKNELNGLERIGARQLFSDVTEKSIEGTRSPPVKY
jgi:hypothetical protein